MSLQEFDLLFAKVERAHSEAEREKFSKRPRRRAIGAGRRFALDLRNRVLLLLFYYRTGVVSYCDRDQAGKSVTFHNDGLRKRGGRVRVPGTASLATRMGTGRNGPVPYAGHAAPAAGSRGNFVRGPSWHGSSWKASGTSKPDCTYRRPARMLRGTRSGRIPAFGRLGCCRTRPAHRCYTLFQHTKMLQTLPAGGEHWCHAAGIGTKYRRLWQSMSITPCCVWCVLI